MTTNLSQCVFYYLRFYTRPSFSSLLYKKSFLLLCHKQSLQHFPFFVISFPLTNYHSLRHFFPFFSIKNLIVSPLSKNLKLNLNNDSLLLNSKETPKDTNDLVVEKNIPLTIYHSYSQTPLPTTCMKLLFYLTFPHGRDSILLYKITDLDTPPHTSSYNYEIHRWPPLNTHTHTNR